MPGLVTETHGLVVETRKAVRELSPLLLDGARHAIRVLETQPAPRG